jgi:cardiolipin synthase
MNDEALLESPPVRRAQRAFQKLSTGTRPVIYSGNRIELLRNGEEYFPRLLAEIDSATQSIYIETYIFELDSIGQKVWMGLAAAAQRGVAVHLLIDGFGSQAAADRLIALLRPKGVKVIER